MIYSISSRVAKSRIVAAIGVAFLAQPVATTGAEASLGPAIEQDYPSLEKLYHDFHTHPELSFREEKTALKLAGELKALGIEVTAGVGGHGVVGVLRNGAGPTVLVRTDLDA